jgi:hypothetical protein
MNTWAELDDENVVLRVLVVDKKHNQDWLVSKLGGTWIQSENESGLPPMGTKNRAGIGFYYDAERNAFISPKLYDSWVFNEDLLRWQPPIPKTTETAIWDEKTISWIEPY